MRRVGSGLRDKTEKKEEKTKKHERLIHRDLQDIICRSKLLLPLISTARRVYVLVFQIIRVLIGGTSMNQ